MCGADLRVELAKAVDAGSSPRVRSRQEGRQRQGRKPGIISACAEQTSPRRRPDEPCGDHLRVCGADEEVVACFRAHLGSSPRVRSRLGYGREHGYIPGIISACAEQTAVSSTISSVLRDHLRVCGADVGVDFWKFFAEGSSPRVRSRPLRAGPSSSSGRIISACAEQTPSATTAANASKDHLRVCGADDCSWVLFSWVLGSSPRVRSRLVPTRLALRAAGIISACAEQTP